MTDYLLQQGRSIYWDCLDLTEQIHRNFARRYGLTFISHRGAVLPDWYGTWDSVPLMLDLVQREDTGLVLWLDADTLIVGDADPREILGECLIGMSRHPGPPEHYNCGVLFLKACGQVSSLLQRILNNGPGEPTWYQQAIINELLTEPQWSGKIKTLPHEWNSTVVLRHPEQCIIRAWHGSKGGREGRSELIAEEIAKRSL